MKSYNFFTLFALFAFALPIHAQIGLRLGLNFTEVNIDIDNSPISVETNMKTGFHVGVFYEAQLGTSISLQPELLYFKKGYRLEDTGNDFNFALNYIELPILVKYNFNGQTSNIFLMAGPSAGLGISARARVGDDSEGLDWADTDLEQLDFGLHLGGGIAFPAGNGNIFLDVRYLLGIANISQSGDGTARNRGLAIGVGYKF